MLKIRDEIDLKELEKFGFKPYWFYDDNLYKTICKGRRGQQFDLIIDTDRSLVGYSEGADGDGEESYIDDTLYDLIKADMVEKVEE